MTAKEILENDFERLGQFQRILVQVNREVASLRRWIMDHGFEIVAEKLVHDRALLSDRRFPQGLSAGCLYRSQLQYGPFLLARREPVFIEYYHYRKAKLERIGPSD